MQINTKRFTNTPTLTTVIAGSLPFLLLLSRTTADLSVVIIGSFFLFRSYQKHNWHWLKQKWVQCLFLFLAYLLLINVPNSLNPSGSFAYSLFFLRWPLFALALGYWVLKAPRAATTFFISLSICMVFLILDSWLQFITGYDLFQHALHPENQTIPPNRLTGPYTKPIIGIMLVRVTFIALLLTRYFQFAKATTPSFIASLSIIMVALLTIFISGERMAFVLCCFGLSTLLIGYWFAYRSLRLKIVFALMLTIASIGLMMMQAPETTHRVITSGLAKLQDFSNSDYGIVLNAAWQTWQENWLIGSGLHTYRHHCELLGVLAQTDFVCSHPHNLYLHLATETGTLGVSLFSLMILSLYYFLIKPHLKRGDWVLGAMVFTILNMSFWPVIVGISLLNNWVASLAWLGVGWCIAILPGNNQK